MYALQTVGSTTSSVKDDTEVLEIDDAGNSIAEQIISNSNAIKRSGKLTKPNGYQSSQFHPAIHNYERDIDDENLSVSLFFWAIFQAVGLACVAAIICRTIMYHEGYFEESSYPNATSISPVQFSNWHFLLITIGLYLYANSIFMIKTKKLDKNKNSDVTLQYVMLHTFAFAVSALALYAIYANKETNKPKDSKFYQGHLYSVHSWVGLCAALMFTVQWLSTVAAFVMPCLRNAGLPPGRTFSLYTVFVSSVALVTGINGHAIKLLKGAYRTYSTESLILNGFGMLVMVFLFLIAFMVLKPTRTLRMYVLHE
ncbi:Cytochrome b561/ferric reductase transmembrane [Cinara cedri]|uniref:Cytochrome b561/ferric reductase transmembrane n=1 Tax=Cinara cedri TaxID=506608 RepID=A0A5E4MSN0_9HEMI|nr:Cytochrome b561/ferric reductase transmembrane [Cinara cedri]